MTPDAENAKAFFAQLFGWSYGEMSGVPGGHLIQVGGKTAGALMDLGVAKLPPGTPAVVGVMIKVEDADATCAKINALGGKADAPVDAMGNGRMAMCADPVGSVFGLWQPKAQQGIDADSHMQGVPSWFETITTDVPRTVKFYTDVFGWKPQAQDMPGFTYTVFNLGSVPIAGAMPKVPQMGDVPPHWDTYFAVDDADVIAKQAPTLGASVCMPVMDIPGVGRFAMFRSPQGVPFHVIEFKRS
jgi:predicted enzyme related to lactoylglutathione lyase